MTTVTKGTNMKCPHCGYEYDNEPVEDFVVPETFGVTHDNECDECRRHFCVRQHSEDHNKYDVSKP